MSAKSMQPEALHVLHRSANSWESLVDGLHNLLAAGVPSAQCVICSLLMVPAGEEDLLSHHTDGFLRLLYVYLNSKALNNLPISRVKRKIYDVSFWQAAADLDSPGKALVLTAPFSEQSQEQLLQADIAMW